VHEAPRHLGALAALPSGSPVYSIAMVTPRRLEEVAALAPDGGERHLEPLVLQLLELGRGARIIDALKAPARPRSLVISTRSTLWTGRSARSGWAASSAPTPRATERSTSTVLRA
jgi:hypothetical protein